MLKVRNYDKYASLKKREGYIYLLFFFHESSFMKNFSFADIYR